MGSPLHSAQSPSRKIDARGKLPAGILIPCLLIFGIFLASCHKKTPLPVQQTQSAAPPLPAASPATATTPAPSLDEQSCRAFVQNFYDWYWNRYAESANSVGFDMHSLPNVESVLKRKPPVLSPELIQLLTDDQKKKQATHQVGNLDFDPFWGNQNAQGMYRVGRLVVKDERCKASIPQGDEIVESQKSGPSWVFVNFNYCFAAYDSTVGRHCPDSDLLQILKK
jgi:hypothetical protein